MYGTEGVLGMIPELDFEEKQKEKYISLFKTNFSSTQHKRNSLPTLFFFMYH
jgi:hypothetical protein